MNIGFPSEVVFTASLGIVVVVALIGVAFFTLSSTIYDWFFTPVLDIQSSVTCQNDRLLDLQLTEVYIKEVNIVNDSSAIVVACNSGQISFAASKKDLFDLIVRYTDLNGAIRSYRLTYDAYVSEPSGWRIVDAYTTGKSFELLNPMDFPVLSKGMWDPSEEVELELWFNVPMNVTLGLTVVFTLPNGYTTMASG